MAQIKVLVSGYAYEEDGAEYASCSVTLIRDRDTNIIVDPGLNQELLLKSLEEEGLGPEDIDYVVLTHAHTDHSALTALFDQADILDGENIYSFAGRIEELGGRVPETDVEIFATPGHDESHCSVLAHDEDLGQVVIAGDVFWWADDEVREADRKGLLDHHDTYAEDMKALRKSREKVLEMADWIVPGHGEIFETAEYFDN